MTQALAKPPRRIPLAAGPTVEVAAIVRRIADQDKTVRLPVAAFNSSI